MARSRLSKFDNCTQSKETIVSHFNGSRKKLLRKFEWKVCYLQKNFFLKTVEPVLSDKIFSISAIYLTENDELVKTDKKSGIFN